MRYLLILVVALALTIAWQTSVVADNPTNAEAGCENTTRTDLQRSESASEALACE